LRASLEEGPSWAISTNTVRGGPRRRQAGKKKSITHS